MDDPLPHPYERGMIVIAGLTLLSLIPVLTGVGLIVTGNQGAGTGLIFIGGLLTFIFGLSLGLAWRSGRRQVAQIGEFLASDRVAIRWTYDDALWAVVQDRRWAGQQGDHTMQIGCLAALFAIVGLLTGGLVRADQGLGPLLLGALVGAAAGALIGVVVGGTIAGTDRLATALARRRAPETVALGRDEVYANGQYFRGDGGATSVRATRIESDGTTVLAVDIEIPARPGTSETETWEIIVPPAVVSDLKDLVEEWELTNERRNDTL